MPERAEVAIFTIDLKAQFPKGSIIDKIESFDDSFPVPIPKRDFPLTVKRVSSKGKKSYIVFENNMALLVSYGMTASWSDQKTKFTKFKFKSVDSVYYWQCKRKLHCETVKYMTREDLYLQLADLGLDIYHPREEATESIILSKYNGKNGKPFTRLIYTFLMDQRRFCGIGNYLRCMILYRMKISPFRKVSELTKEEKIGIYTVANVIIEEIIAMGGHTVFDWQRADGRTLGHYDVTPYKKINDNKGNYVKMEKVGINSHIYWCPDIQK